MKCRHKWVNLKANDSVELHTKEFVLLSGIVEELREMGVLKDSASLTLLSKILNKHKRGTLTVKDLFELEVISGMRLTIAFKKEDE